MKREELVARAWVALDGLLQVRSIHATRAEVASTVSIAVDVDLLDQRGRVQAHYRLLRAMPRPDVMRVAFFDSVMNGEPPRWIAPEPLRPSLEEIAHARAAIATFTPEVEPELSTTPSCAADPPQLLVVDPSPFAVYAYARALPEANVVGEWNLPWRYLGRCYRRKFDLVLYALDIQGGVPSELPARSPDDPEIVWTVDGLVEVPADRFGVSVVQRPVPIELVRGALQRAVEAREQRNRSAPVELVRPEPPSEASGRPRVLVLEQDPAQRAITTRVVERIASTSAPEDEWAALDALEHGAWSAVLCDVSWRTPGGEPMHRMVRRIRPELARAIVLVSARPPDAPNPRVLVRPLTEATVRAALH